MGYDLGYGPGHPYVGERRRRRGHGWRREVLPVPRYALGEVVKELDGDTHPLAALGAAAPARRLLSLPPVKAGETDIFPHGAAPFGFQSDIFYHERGVITTPLLRA